MDLKAVKEAMEQLRVAKEEIARLQRQREDAEKSVKEAKAAAVAATESHKQESVDYSDETYWETRYKKSKNQTSETLYEWYVDFKSIKSLLEADINILQSNTTLSQILVSGCGNSSFCEDLCSIVPTSAKIIGMDYSSSVIDLMNQRATEKSLRNLNYFQADARYMPNVASGSYDILLDKGTLDAIATGGVPSQKNSTAHYEQNEDAANYMLEMWRVLKIGGMLILITTMPAQILEQIGIAPLGMLTQSKEGVRSSVCNWKGAGSNNMKALSTAEGGQVFYYAITKTANCEKLSSHGKKPAISKVNGSGKDDIMAGITALLEEAKKAKEQMELAAERQSRAAADMKDVEGKKAALNQKLEVDMKEMEDEGLSENEVQRAVHETVLRVAPKVMVAIDPDAELIAGASAHVYFLLKKQPQTVTATNTSESAGESSAWHEDDTVCLVCCDRTLSNECEDGALYKIGDHPYEVFEYTDRPRLLDTRAIDSDTSHADRDLLQRLDLLHLLQYTKDEAKCEYFIGKVKVTFPTYGSVCRISYVRTVTLPERAGGKIVQERIRLATSTIFDVAAPVFGAHPDARTNAVQILFANASERRGGKRGGHVRRRGAGALRNNCVDSVTMDGMQGIHVEMFAEDLAHIRTLTVTSRIALTSNMTQDSGFRDGVLLSRCMAWATEVEPNNNSLRTMRIFVEFDLVRATAKFNCSATCASEVSILYGILDISDDLFSYAAIDLTRASVRIIAPGYVQCRFPYSVDVNQSSKKVSALVDGPLQKLQSLYTTDENIVTTQVMCQFCRSGFIQQPDCIKQCRPLPTGLLDNMMHEFICCEELPSGTLISSELETPRNTILYGDAYLSIHPTHLRAECVQVLCKTFVTQLDVLTGCGGALATAPIDLKGINSGKKMKIKKDLKSSHAEVNEDERVKRCLQAFKAVINIDTVLIRCSRCEAYLGDAQLCGEGCEISCTTHNSSKLNGKADTSGTSAFDPTGLFSLSDVRDVRFSPSAVVIMANARDAPAIEIQVTSEQTIAQCLLHMNSVYGVASFVLYVGDANLESTTDDMSIEGMGIVVKIVSRDFRASQPCTPTDALPDVNPIRVNLKPCLKVSYHKGRLFKILSGNEARVPLLHHQLRAVLRVLESRGTWMCESPFPGQTLSFLSLSC